LIPLVLVVSALLGGMYGPRVTAQNDDSDARVQDSLRRITQVLRTAEKNYADPVDPEEAIFSGAIPGMLHTLDPHSNFLIRRALRNCATSSAAAITGWECRSRRRTARQ
jgi:carboxyl-terminal processing protease